SSPAPIPFIGPPTAAHTDPVHVEPPAHPVATPPGPAQAEAAHPEPAAPPPEAPATSQPSAEPLFTWPTIPERGLFSVLMLLVGALLAATAAELAQRVRSDLRPRGLLPSLAALTHTVGRATAVLLVLGAVAAVLPQGLRPVLPWVAVAGALALGWSLRDVLPDVVAWAFLSAEGRIEPGLWVRGDGFEGRVESLALRATWVVDTRGARTSIPNRLLLRHPVRATLDRWPEAEVCVHLPEAGPAVARAALREAALLSPWLAPEGQPEIGQDPGDVSRWTVRVRVLDGRYRDRFEGTFPERVRDVLAARRSR
ncbi:MAG: mechanosensitive ion channel family protein, partial [Myxococcales bacterium]|nr:mechanosensitive ion channel family protein [Myxococcales bacterium]